MMFYKICRKLVKAISYIFFPIRVHGKENMINEGRAILCPNHFSYMDPIAVALSVKRHIRFVVKESIFNKPVLKQIFKLIDAHPIKQNKADMAAIKFCLKTLKNEHVLGIFPEGTRVRGSKVVTPKGGPIMIAYKTNSPIIYMRIKPKFKNFIIFCPTDIYISKPITCKELGVENGTNEEFEAAAKVLVDKIYKLGDEE